MRHAGLVQTIGDSQHPRRTWNITGAEGLSQRSSFILWVLRLSRIRMKVAFVIDRT